VSSGYLVESELDADARTFLPSLVAAGRATRAAVGTAAERRHVLVAAERLPELLAIHPEAVLSPSIAAPPSRAARAWTAAEACAEILRDRLTILGPVTIPGLAASLAIPPALVEEALLMLEGSGVVLRGAFSARDAHEWCDRRLLARIHRQTVARLRAEIEPVSPADFMRFLFAWQHVSASHRLQGIDGLREVLSQLDGVSLAAAAWERDVLPIRVTGYDGQMLDTLCLGGETGWARRGSAESTPAGLVAHTPVALFARDHAAVWAGGQAGADVPLSEAAVRIRDCLRARGASFVRDLQSALSRDGLDVQAALGELVVAGLVTSDAFGGVRGFLSPRPVERPAGARDGAGRWSLLASGESPDGDEAIEIVARGLLRRYGVVCRRLAVHEDVGVPWRDFLRLYWRLEARGEIRGGRFVSGWSGEQFALPDAVTRMREVRRQPAKGDVVVLSACDPLNLTGVVDSGERIRAATSTRVAYRDGVPAAALEGEYLRPLATLEPSVAAVIAGQLTGREPLAVTAGFVGRPRRRLA
jgi:ATP-dependent Lhr-like helicase